MRHSILVVEDNPLNMELATDILHAARYTVLQAGNAETGISLARSDRPALILMDVSLPGMDGLTATRELKKDPATRDIPVVALTAHAMKGDMEKAFAAGCNGYLTKPVDINALPKAIARFIEDSLRR